MFKLINTSTIDRIYINKPDLITEVIVHFSSIDDHSA